MGNSRWLSTQKNTASSTADRANAARIRPSLQPRAFPSIRAYTRKNRPPVPVTSPGGSMRREVDGSLLSVTTRYVMTSPMIPIGTLM